MTSMRPSPSLTQASKPISNADAAKQSVSILYKMAKMPDTDDPRIYIAAAITAFSAYPTWVQEKAIELLPRRFSRPDIKNITEMCEEIIASHRDAYTVRERERSQLTERMLIEAFNEKHKPDPGWYERQKADLAARGMFIGDAKRNNTNAKAEAISLLKEKYGMTDEMFNELPNAPNRKVP